jgi:hypothetical protein
VQNQPFDGFMGQNNHMQLDQPHVEEEDVELFQESDSIVVNHSDNSSVNSVHPAQIAVNFCQFYSYVSCEETFALLAGAKSAKSAVYGPVLPPHMQQKNMFELLLKQSPIDKVPLTLQVQSIFEFVAKTWPLAPELSPAKLGSVSIIISDKCLFL